MEIAPSVLPAVFAVAPNEPPQARFACLILARDESAVLAQSLECLRLALSPGDPVVVVADHCRDDTAEVARAAGATVLVRREGQAGKGAALAWFFRLHAGLVRELPAVLVLDADSRLAPEAGPAIAAQAGLAKAFQCRLLPADYDGSGLATLMALSEIVDQSMHDRLRTRLGWPVRLRGTGMLLPPAALEQVSPELSTEVEDIALTLLLAAAGLPIERLEAAVVRDPKPRKVAAGARQRARWFRGQWIALWRYRAQVLRVAAQGPRGWSLLSSLFLKPRWLAALTAALLALACRAWPWVAGPLWIWVAAQAFALGAGLLFLGQERWLFLKALAYVPGFVLMWLRGMALALRRLPWPRVRAQP